VSSGTWASTATLNVGFSGTGTLNVTGGYVSNNAGSLGDRSLSVGTATVSSGTWANSGNLTVGTSGTGTLTMSGGLVSVSGTLSKGTYGTINLNSGGTLQIGVGGTTGVLGVSALTDNGTLIFNRSDASTYSGVISGSGAVTKQGGGTLTMSGSSTYSGNTAVTAGTLMLNGRLTSANVIVQSGALLGGSGTIVNIVQILSGGTVSPGNSPGILTVGGLDLQSGATALMQITGTIADTGYDRIVSTGNIDYDSGVLQVQMSGTGYAVGTMFDLFDAITVSGTLGSISMAGSSDGWQSLAWYAPGASGAGLYAYGPGVWQSDWTNVGGDSRKLIFNQASGVMTVVPEPSTFVMAGAGIAALAAIRWRRTRHGRRLKAKLAA